jgi:colicin import membrane protein
MATMNPAALLGAPYQVPPEPSRTPSIVLAMVVHAGLLGFLWAGVSWQNTPPVAVEAEVWDLKVREAAPQRQPEPEPVRPPEPKVIPKEVEEPVAPKAPDIALERLKEQKKLLKEKQKELEEQKLKDLADKKAKELADKKVKAAQELAEKKKLDKLRDDEMKRLTSQAGGSGTAPKSTAPSTDAGYGPAVSRKIKSAVRYAGDKDVPGDPRVAFKIEQLPTGEIISVRKTKSSGIPAFDDAVERAINNSSPLPKKKDGTVDRSIDVGYKLKDFSDAD